MNLLRRCGIYFLLCALSYFFHPLLVFSQTAPSATLQTADAEQASQHDFDFNTGTWKTHIMYLEHPLTGSSAWDELDGTVVVRKIWDGRAQVEEFKSDNSEAHFESTLLRLYNPDSHQWSFIYGNDGGTILCAHMIGGFKNGQGEFVDHEPFNGKLILARTRWSYVARDSHRYEIAFSDDNGKTWETNFIAAWARKKP